MVSLCEMIGRINGFYTVLDLMFSNLFAFDLIMIFTSFLDAMVVPVLLQLMLLQM